MNNRDEYGIRSRASHVAQPSYFAPSNAEKFRNTVFLKGTKNIDSFGSRKRLRKQCSGMAFFCEINFPDRSSHLLVSSEICPYPVMGSRYQHMLRITDQRLAQVRPRSLGRLH